MVQALFFAAALPLGSPVPSATPYAYAVFDELDRMGARLLWPGFEPGRIPVAIHDGNRTFLYRHPSPPDDFASVSARINVGVSEGRHPAVTANSSAEIGGVVTATALLEGSARSDPRAAAAVLIHESFHVWTAGRHPAWTSNEMDLFTYPMDDAEATALADLEARTLYTAVEARADSERLLCTAAAAVALRRERFARLPESARSYERGLELKEGLATYVQGRALNRPAARQSGFPVSSVRDRVYLTGESMALLLDQVDPSWKGRLDEKPAKSLDELLARAVESEKTQSCGTSPRERAQARRKAAREVAKIQSQRRSTKNRFLEATGWKLEVVADGGGEILWPQGFDPLNLESLGGNEAMHTRWLKAGNERGAIEVLNRNTLTEGAGAHPILEGIRKVVVTALPRPAVEEKDGTVKVTAEGVKLEFRGARVERTGRIVRIHIGSS